MGKEKEKVIYVDDGSTIADMSGMPDRRPNKRHPATPHPKFKDVWNTYWSAVRMMLLPTAVFCGGLLLAFAATWLIFKLM